MYLPGKLSDETERLLQRINQLTQALLEGFELDQEVITLEGVESLYELFDQHQLFLVQDGMLHYSPQWPNAGQL